MESEKQVSSDVTKNTAMIPSPNKINIINCHIVHIAGASNENIVQNHLNIALLNVF